ncbi:hypothetical protein D0860_04464 [Hortaea werneckii]|uniref:Uncharacterized protein n=1 Tax=Hortaea werneckii TaxID=91943 RepID=A0A3M7H7B0_HORWE|nr:hypothetical protein D0860_04464 [Hortaea werneckii]RMZ32054.1 hypothetical protein D0859_03832 [Hortaea werneckii]
MHKKIEMKIQDCVVAKERLQNKKSKGSNEASKCASAPFFSLTFFNLRYPSGGFYWVDLQI